MSGLYMTDYGPCRVSDDEAHTLRVADELRTKYDTVSQLGRRTIARAELIHAACERFAKYSDGGSAF